MATFISDETNKSEKIDDLINKNAPNKFISVEFFPPKTDAGVSSLFSTMKELQSYQPIFVDFTWGAGGATSDLTVDLCRRAKEEL
eukprot:CAMPEP_0119046620 /NCGR_PEP_ID=MMETSP1177-20130426/47813_1 /TAXON_ID=2985 /ORGANISM="Ochromonas sp, Strain CCMP1899" /LENGTH=84 /DNA_ID=CAMNT_0007020021 /DNA_START=21 /DNA_END=272 /DNA_ORIENTATION=+